MFTIDKASPRVRKIRLHGQQTFFGVIQIAQHYATDTRCCNYFSTCLILHLTLINDNCQVSSNEKPLKIPVKMPYRGNSRTSCQWHLADATEDSSENATQGALADEMPMAPARSHFSISSSLGVRRTDICH